MSQSLSKIILHVVFSTKERRALIPPLYQDRLFAYIATLCRDLSSEAFRVGGVEDHVHIACLLPKTMANCDFLEDIKKKSSKWMKQTFPTCRSFTWQNGYGTFSLGESQLPSLIKYIENQKQHHKKMGFKEEYIDLLKKYGVEYDERFLWD